VNPVLVTCACGNVGAEVVRACRDRGLAVRAADRDVARVRARWGDEVSTVRLDFLDRETWPDALEGVSHLFLVRPPAIADVQNNLNPFIDEARARDVDHVVFLSVAGAGENRFVPHRKVEDHLRDRGDRHTNLRPGFFAQNLESAYREDIVEDDRIYVPAGRRQPVNWIDARDIADVAALVLEDPEPHRSQSYTLAGAGPVPWSEVIDALSTALGRTIRYEPASIVGYARHLARRGLPRGAIAVQTILHVLLRFGQGAKEDPTLERLLGRRPRTIREYIEDRAPRFARPGEAAAAQRGDRA